MLALSPDTFSSKSSPTNVSEITSSTAIYLEPSRIDANPLEYFTVALNIHNVTDLHDWQAQLEWNPQTLEFVNLTRGDFFNSTSSIQSVMNQTEGWALIFDQLPSPWIPPTTGVSGNGTLANIVFRGTEEGGECTLSLNKSKLFDSNPELVSTPPNLGDVNNNSAVNMADVGTTVLAFGHSVGEPGYNPNADFNSDGFVDLFDLLCVEENFGRFYPPYPEPSQAYRPVEIPHLVGIHDVTIDDVTPPKTVVGAGYSVSINTTVANEVYFPEAFNVTLYVNETSIALQNVTLTAGASITLRFTWNTTGFAKGNYTVSTYAEPVPNETNLADNNLTCPVLVHVGVPGDISGPIPGVYDGTTNMRDIQYLILLFNTNPSSPNWKPNADINDDGTVNMRDIQIAILNFNQYE